MVGDIQPVQSRVRTKGPHKLLSSRAASYTCSTQRSEEGFFQLNFIAISFPPLETEKRRT